MQQRSAQLGAVCQDEEIPCLRKVMRESQENFHCPASPVNNVDDGTRTRNHRSDSPSLDETTEVKQGISTLSDDGLESGLQSILTPSLIPMLDPELLAISQAWGKMPEIMKAVIRSMAALTNATTPKPEPKADDGDKLPWEEK